MLRSPHTSSFCFALSLLLLAACGGGGDGGATPTPPTPPPAPVTVASVTVTGAPSAPLDAGLTATLTASPRTAAGATVSGRTVSWSTSNAAVATVSSAGVVTAAGTGQASITATVDGVSGAATVPVLVRPASVAIAAEGRWLLTGDTLSVQAIVRDRLDRVMDTSATLTLSGTAATLSSTNARSGVLTATAPGTATLRATLGALNAEATVQVAPGDGARVRELAVLDSVMIAELVRLRIPGASVAIARNGALMFARAYGWADTTKREVMRTTSMLRVGSTSKPLTAVAVHRLVQEGRLSLDDRPFGQQLAAISALPGRTEDPRLVQATVRDLLQHTTGWGSRAVDDTVWAAFWRDGTNDQTVAARYGRGVPLATAPGTAHVYTNYGYQVLGRLIEQVTGESYEQAVQRLILTPAGVTGMRLGRTPFAQRDPNEATCYDGLPTTTSRYGTGAWCDVAPGMEYYEASGSWIATATDMVRWMSVVDGHAGGRADVLNATTLNAMTARDGVLWPGTGAFYALGWQVSPESGGTRWFHSGAATGGDAWISRLPNGVVVAVLANLTRGRALGGGTLDPAVLAAVRGISTWPVGTMF
ncbi:MAG: serine hydrolase [Gemmatimonadaceae bacterium]|nr:serine hydrolase [Gemmatimonadaceae bacterium]